MPGRGGTKPGSKALSTSKGTRKRKTSKSATDKTQLAKPLEIGTQASDTLEIVLGETGISLIICSTTTR